MANKNHDLDQPILTAAKKEFLENGYEKASLRKIASNAKVTIGAIYTRYPTKDALFTALCSPLLKNIEETFSMIRTEYHTASAPDDPTQFASLMQDESNAILHLLFDDYDSAVLLLCKNTGSSLENFFDKVIDCKIKETLSFFRSASMKHPPENVLKILVESQFHSYYQIIRSGCSLEEARQLMNEIMAYHTGGWMTLFQKYFHS